MRKLSLGVYDALFSSKFADWKWDGEHRCKNSPSNSPHKPLSAEDAEKLGVELALKQASRAELVLEDITVSSNLNVVTESLDMWILDEASEVLKEIPFSHDLDQTNCYVIKWKYRVQLSGEPLTTFKQI